MYSLCMKLIRWFCIIDCSDIAIISAFKAGFSVKFG